MNLTKMKYLYIENYEPSMKKIEEDTIKMKNNIVLWVNVPDHQNSRKSPIILLWDHNTLKRLLNRTE